MEDIAASAWFAKVLMVVLAALAALGSRLVAALTTSATARAVLGHVGTEIRDVVLEVWQTYVSGIKAGQADGKLTDEEKKTAREMALQKLKANLGAKGLARLGRIVGLSDGALDGWLVSKIEAGVAQAKLLGAAAGARTSGKDAQKDPPRPSP